MASRIKILFGSNPYIWAYMDFSVSNTETGFSKIIQKRFVPGIPVTAEQVKIGATLEDTIVNLITNLSENNSWSVMNYTAVTDGVLIDFTPAGNYTYNENTAPGDWDLTYEYYEVTSVEDLLPFELGKDISIEIIDTYDNDRVLIEEFTQIQSPRLAWDSGDDIYEPFMTSKLVFNMLVPDAADGKFFHLFTGDEKRYRVEVYSIKEDESKDLIWQGFLLPDLYSEPYQNGVFFVEFTAVDMIASLKGKTLKPWFYYNRFPIAQLMAYCLENTGLLQEFIVSPSLVPASPTLSWRDINVPLSHYVDGLKYTDCYEILKDVLEANGLTLYSFRGYWFVKGISRKHEAINSNSIVLNAAGIQTGLVNVVNKVSEPMMSSGTPSINVLSPWSEVAVDFKSKVANLFSDDVVVCQDLKTSHYFYTGFSELIYTDGTRIYYPKDKNLNSWINNASSDFRYNKNDHANFEYDQAISRLNYTESMALSNYFECPETVYIERGMKYELELEFETSGTLIDLSASEISDRMKSNYYDKIFPFQLLVDNTEIVSNRPSFPGKNSYKFSVTGPSNLKEWNFKLKKEFVSDISGFLKFRLLVPIQNFSNDKIIFPSTLFIKVLKIKAVKDLESTVGVVAARPINFTTKKSVEIAFNCTINTSVINNLGLKYPKNVGGYFYTIDRTVNPEIYTDVHQFSRYNFLTLTYRMFDISVEYYDVLFRKGKKFTGFLVKENGDEIVFNSLWGQKLINGWRMGYLKEYEGYPNLPDNYKAYSDAEVVAEDVLKFMDVKYDLEEISERNFWKLYGLTNEKSFVKILVDLYHFVRPEETFSLETTFLDLIFPNELVAFNYMDEDRNFIPTRLELDLSGGKTTAKTTEAKFVELENLIYG